VKRRIVPSLAWLLLLTCVILDGLTLVVVMLWTPGGQLLGWEITLSFLMFPIVGALIVSRRPRNTVGWLLCAFGIGSAVTSFSAAFVQHAIALHTDAQLATGLVDALGNLVWPLNIALCVLLLLVFPDGRVLSPRWRSLVWLTIPVTAAQCVMGLLQPEPLEHRTGRDLVVNPFGVPALGPVINALYPLTQVASILLVLAAIASVIVRYRRATGVVRQQIKWPAVGAALAVLFIASGVILATALAPAGQDAQNSPISNTGFALAFFALPASIGVGVLRHRLYDIDVLINRALVYGALTAFLVVLYAAGVFGAQLVAGAITRQVGVRSQSPLVIVATTLLVAALIRPLRARVQRLVDRRFYRAKYDAQKTLAAFGATLRTETDLGQLTDHLLGVVDETMRPAQVSLWLRETGRTEISR
jgi:hypothetical protein